MQEQSLDPRVAISPAHAYLIGGVPRVGKSTVARAVLRRRPMFAIPTDALRSVLKNVDTRNHAALFGWPEELPEDRLLELCRSGQTQTIIDIQNAESEVVWREMKTMIYACIEEGFDVLVEGVAVLPSYVKELECNYSAVFVGDSTLDPTAMLAAARANPMDWMHQLSDETVEHFVHFTADYSAYFKQQAEQHQLPYIELRDGSFEADIELAAGSLLSSN